MAMEGREISTRTKRNETHEKEGLFRFRYLLPFEFPYTSMKTDLNPRLRKSENDLRHWGIEENRMVRKERS